MANGWGAEVEVDSDKDNTLYTVQAALVWDYVWDNVAQIYVATNEHVEIISVDAARYEGNEHVRDESLTGEALTAFAVEYGKAVEERLRGKMESQSEAHHEWMVDRAKLTPLGV